MPILSSSSSADCNIVSSSCCSASSLSDDETPTSAEAGAAGAAGARGSTQPQQQRATVITQLDDEIEEYEADDRSANMPKKRGPKKKRMTPARIAKLKQRRLKVSNRSRYSDSTR